MRLYCGHSLNNTIYHTKRPNDCQPQFDVVWAVSFIGLFYMDKISGIYKITNSINNKYYIGSTNHATLAQRLGKHRSNYKDYLNNNNGYISSFEILFLVMIFLYN